MIAKLGNLTGDLCCLGLVLSMVERMAEGCNFEQLYDPSKVQRKETKWSSLN